MSPVRRHRTRAEEDAYRAGASDVLVAIFATPPLMADSYLREVLLELALGLGLGVQVGR